MTGGVTDDWLGHTTRGCDAGDWDKKRYLKRYLKIVHNNISAANPINRVERQFTQIEDISLLIAVYEGNVEPS